MCFICVDNAQVCLRWKRISIPELHCIDLYNVFVVIIILLAVVEDTCVLPLDVKPHQQTNFQLAAYSPLRYHPTGT